MIPRGNIIAAPRVTLMLFLLYFFKWLKISMILNDNLPQLLKLPREKWDLQEVSGHYTAHSDKVISVVVGKYQNSMMAESNTKHKKCVKLL